MKTLTVTQCQRCQQGGSRVLYNGICSVCSSNQRRVTMVFAVETLHEPTYLELEDMFRAEETN